MSESKSASGSDLAKVDAHQVTPEEYDEIPELTDEFFDRATIHENGILASRPRGRPSLKHPKRQVTLRLDEDVVERFRGTGRGWQSRINDALRKVVGL